MSENKDNSESSENSYFTMTDSSGEFNESALVYVSASSIEERGNEKSDETEKRDIVEQEEEDEELVKAIKAAKEKNRIHPSSIDFEDLIVDVSFHPTCNIIAGGSVVGDVFLYKYSNENNELIQTLELHTKACRDIEFNEDGSILFSCGKDKSIMLTDTDTGKLKKFYDDAHENPLYSLYVYDDNIICTGDEEGVVKVWDIRLNRSVMSFKHMEDFVSDMITNDAKKHLVCSSGDGTITSYSMSSKKLFMQSEGYDSELNCLDLLKYECKLLTCSSKGKMYIYNWGEFGYHCDVYSGPKNAINRTIAVTENMIVAGYEDGNIRAVNFYPQSQLGVVGQHDFSIESLDISHDGEFIASSSLDQKIKFWNIRYFEDLFVKKKKNHSHSKKKVESEVNLPSSKVRNISDFFDELK